MKVIVQYRLRPQTDAQEYLRWSADRDHPILRATPGILGFDVYTVTPESGTTDVTVVELIEVATWDDWKVATQSPGVAALGPDFERLVDTDSVVILRGEAVAPA